MYWVKNEEGGFEVMDGQQRTISFCEYVEGKFSLNFQYFHNLEQTKKDQQPAQAQRKRIVAVFPKRYKLDASYFSEISKGNASKITEPNPENKIL